VTSRALTRFVPVAIAALAVAGALAVVLSAGGHAAGSALGALARGAAGSPEAFLSVTLVRATPLILLGLAVAIAFQAGVLNIGADGQFLAGATAAFVMGLLGRTWPPAAVVIAVLAAGAAGGAAWAALPAALKRRFGTLEVLSTLLLNFVAALGVSYLVRGPLQEPTRVNPMTVSLDDAARLPMVVPGTRLHLGVALALAAAAALWWVLRSTAAGFRVRAVGAGAAAAESAGRVNAARVATACLLASGALAGLAGAGEVAGRTYALFENLSPGWGYTAIAVALLARLHPIGVVGTGLFFGALDAGAAAMQRDAGVSAEFVSIVVALVVLGVLAVEHAGTRAADPAPAGRRT
jgi:simple sugar transport system permease protein